MDGLEYDDIATLSRKVREAVEAEGMKIANPFKGTRESFSAYENRDYKDVVERDIRELKTANVFLCDMTIRNRNYIGTLCEMMYAYYLKIPVVIYTGDTGYENRYWIRYHAKHICTSLEEAIESIRNSSW